MDDDMRIGFKVSQPYAAVGPIKICLRAAVTWSGLTRHLGIRGKWYFADVDVLLRTAVSCASGTPASWLTAIGIASLHSAGRCSTAPLRLVLPWLSLQSGYRLCLWRGCALNGSVCRCDYVVVRLS